MGLELFIYTQRPVSELFTRREDNSVERARGTNRLWYCRWFQDYQRTAPRSFLSRGHRVLSATRQREPVPARHDDECSTDLVHRQHLPTSTVRESLEFSALLRQPAATSRAEKLAYVDEVIKMLQMENFQHAVVGVVGQGLSVEQRKRLTIGE